VSDLRNYNEVLRNVGVSRPVFLTKNGRGRFVIVDITEYEKTQATIVLLTFNRARKRRKAARKMGTFLIVLWGENMQKT
jgi:prevent-host-death family protein